MSLLQCVFEIHDIDLFLDCNRGVFTSILRKTTTASLCLAWPYSGTVAKKMPNDA